MIAFARKQKPTKKKNLQQQQMFPMRSRNFTHQFHFDDDDNKLAIKPCFTADSAQSIPLSWTRRNNLKKERDTAMVENNNNRLDSHRSQHQTTTRRLPSSP